MRRHQSHAHPLRPRWGRRVARGLTLLELMLSVALGVVVLVAATVMLLSASRMRRNQQLLSDANQEARTALKNVSRTLASAGAGGNTFNLRDNLSAVQKQVSVIAFKNGTSLQLRDVAGAPVAASITSTTMKQRPDELVVLRYGADRRSDLVGNLVGSTLQMTPDPRLSTTPGVIPTIFLAEESALITNFNKAILLPVKSAAPNGMYIDVTLLNEAKSEDVMDSTTDIQPGASVFPVRVIRYRLAYVPKQGNFPERTDLLMETIDPTLMLQDFPPAKRVVVLARDVEDFQVQWGYDYNADGVADTGYGDTGPASKGMDAGLTFARVSLAVRTSTTLMDENGQALANDKKETTPLELGLDTSFGGTPQDPTKANGYRRRIMSTVVALKNVAAKRI
jgi:type IV pilus assembly protein PilW